MVRDLDASETWSESASTYPHPEYEDAAFLLYDVAVVKLSEPVVLDEHGSLPEPCSSRSATASKGSEPETAFGGDTRKKADRRLVSFEGVYGSRNIAVKFSHATDGTITGAICFGDFAGPTFDTSTPELEAENVIVAVTSFGMTQTCTSSGSYRIDQADDLAFLAAPASNNAFAREASSRSRAVTGWASQR